MPYPKLRSAGACAAALAAGALVAACASTSGNAPPPRQGVYFIAPTDGATVPTTFMVRFGLVGMTVRPAGELVDGTGHHHLLINHGATPKGDVIPADDTHIHFGKGQTETEVKLPPGNYKLTMQFADGYHASYGKDMSATIAVTVK